jgi:hypothetical protein
MTQGYTGDNMLDEVRFSFYDGRDWDTKEDVAEKLRELADNISSLKGEHQNWFIEVEKNEHDEIMNYYLTHL